MSITQDAHIGELITPLGKDVLCLERFDGFEGLSELFEFHIDSLSESGNIDFEQALGQSCSIKLKTYKGVTRIFDGILTEAQWIEMGDGYHRYRLVLRPWFALLGHKANCRIFLNKNVKDIIQQVFTDAGFSDFEFKTTEDYDTIEYCVQYRETDLAFCSRLMEQYGIYYFFKYSEGQHTMVLADSRSSLAPNPDVSSLPYLGLAPRELDQEQRLGAWTSQRRFETGKVTFNDYDYLQPSKNLLAPNEGSESYSHSKLEVYDYPGKYDDQDKGKKFSKIRLQAEQCLDHRRYAEGDAPSLFSGSLVTVEQHAISSENKEYIVVRSNHSYGIQKYLASREGGTEEVYRGLYEFLPSDIPFRALPLTPKPRVLGIETAKVVTKQGEDGEEISTDEHGRIWVKFFWDREPQKTCPIRVAQVWSGKQWGGQFIPRIDMEVVVEFLEGDPDRPLIVGCVFNGDNKYPYTLPDNKTQSGLKSDSSKGHGGYNEFMFEDKKGSEDIRMHAEKNHDVTIKDTQTVTIGEAFTGDNGSASRNWTLQQGDDKLEVAAGNQMVHIAQTQQINVDNDITITSLTSITLQVGSNTIVIDQSGVHIDAMTIDLNGDATINETAPMININS
jgi:type VI secretion system secreted protein VgrG